MSRESAVIPWKRPSPNVVQSRSISDGMQQIMLILPQEDGRHLFSDAIAHPFQMAKQPKVELSKIELYPGTEVKGKLSDLVPRPIRNGWISCASLPTPAGDTWDQKLPSLMYYDGTKINEDGTFHFPSLPSTGTIQLIATCDGWVGKQDEKQPFVVGQVFEIEDESEQIVLTMERAFDAKVRVLDSSGNPLPKITVHCSPNQLYRKGGSTILGESFRSLDAIEAELLKEVKPIKGLTSRYSATTDDHGVATLRNLPRNRLSASFVIIGAQVGKKKYLSNERIAGKLPTEGEDQVEFDVTLEEDK